MKNDTANPTHSFKDRVVAVALAKARELGYQVVACASTGNLANAVAAHSAAAGLESYVFIPSDLEEQKVLATGVYGTNLVAVRGTYDDVNRLCTEISGERDWAFVNVNLRPYYSQGSKTIAFEIAEQLGFELPDRRGGADRLRLAVHQDRARASRSGSTWGSCPAHCPPSTARRPRAALRSRARSRTGRDVCRPVKPDTIAKSLAIGNPADGPYALDLARRSDGSIDSVSDDEIREGIRLLAQTTGIFTETAGGVTTAVLREAGGARRHRPGRAGGRGDHRRRAEDARRGARHVREARDRAVGRSVRERGRRSHGRRCVICRTDGRDGQDPHAVAERHGRRLGDGGRRRDHRRRGARRPLRPLRRPPRPHRGGRRPAPLRQRVRGRRGHPLPRRARHAVEDGDEVTILPAVAGGS